MTSPKNKPSKSIDTTYMEPAITEDGLTIEQIRNSINKTLVITPEKYKNELLKRINHFLDNLNNDFQNEDYTSNYIGYINLIENYISQLEKMVKIDSTIDTKELNKKLDQIKKNQIQAKQIQEKKNKEKIQNNISDPFSKYSTILEY